MTTFCVCTKVLCFHSFPLHASNRTLGDNLSLSTIIRLTFLAFSDILKMKRKAWAAKRFGTYIYCETKGTDAETFSSTYFRKDIQAGSA